jgi:hypothetical protein
MNYGWLEVVGLMAPDITAGEYLLFDAVKGEDHKHYHCKGIREGGRFAGYIDPVDASQIKSLEVVWAPIEFEPARYGLKSTNFEAQLDWLHEQNVREWTFYPIQGLTDGMIYLAWGFVNPDDAMLFKLTWA